MGRIRVLAVTLAAITGFAVLMPSLGLGFGFDTARFPLGSPSRSSIYPRLAVGDDRIYALWAGTRGITAQSFADGGRTPLSESVLSVCTKWCDTDSWRIAASGSRVWATWVEAVNDNDRIPHLQVRVAASVNGGVTWSAAERVGEGGDLEWFPEIAAAGNQAYVVWQDSQGVRMRTMVGTALRPETRNLAVAFRSGSARVAAAQDGAVKRVVVAWDERAGGVTVRSSDNGGSTFFGREIGPGLRLEDLATSATAIHVLASGLRLRAPVSLLSSTDSGDHFRTTSFGNAHCRAGCDVAAVGDRIAVAFNDSGSISVSTGELSSLTTTRVADAPPDWGFPRVALTPTTAGVVWTASPTAGGPGEQTFTAASTTEGRSWSILAPEGLRGGESRLNTVVPQIAGLDTGFGVAFMAFDGDFLPNTAIQPAYRHADAGEPNLTLVSATPTQVVDDVTLVKGKATALVAKVRNTTGRLQVVNALVETGDDGASETQRMTTVEIAPGLTTVLVPGVGAPLRPGGDKTFAWGLTLDPDDNVLEDDETDNDAHGLVAVKASVPDLRVLFRPVRVGGSAHPTCGGDGPAKRELERVVGGRALVDAVMALDERRSSYTAICGALTYSSKKVETARVLTDLSRFALAGDPTKVVGVTQDGFFRDHDTNPKEVNAIGLAFLPEGSGLYRCADGLLMENGVAAGAAPGLLTGGVLAHELLHTTGFPHLPGAPAPGTWVAEGRRFDASYVDLMDPFTQAKEWIAERTYSELRATLQAPQPSCTKPTFAPGRARAAAARAPGPTLAIGGTIDAAGTVAADPFYERHTVADLTLGPAEGAIEARLLDAAGATLGSAFFDPHEATSESGTPGTPGVGSFLVRVPLPAATRRVQLYRDGVLRFERARSAAAPTVTVSAPNGGERIGAGDNVTVDWTSADGDGGALRHLLALSTDGGATWSPLAADVTGSSFTFKATDSMVSDRVRVRVDASDGWRTATDASDASFAITGSSEGLITYVKNIRARCGDLMTVRPDGSDTRTLLEGNNCHPRWSPDGTRIAFTADDDITIVNADGSGLHEIYDECVVSAPDWSPDGTRLVFVDECGNTLKSIGADGTGLIDMGVTAGAGMQPRWSPAGDRIAFFREFPDTLVFVDPDGGNESSFPLEFGLGTADWSPDGKRFVYEGEHGVLWTINADGTGKTQIGTTPTDGVGAEREFGAAWSPGGDRLVLSRAGLSSAEQWHADELAIENADGTGVVQVTHDGAATLEVFPDWQARAPVSDAVVVADAGGPYTGPEGSPIALDASGSTAAAGVAAYAWDLDGDGEFDDATGAKPSIAPPDDGDLGVAVLVTDRRGHTGVARVAVAVANVAPTVTFERPGSVDLAGRATLAARVGDPGDDEQSVTVDWQDGTRPEHVPLLIRGTGAGDVLAFHDYSATGLHTATVHADDGDGGQGEALSGFNARPPNSAPTVADAAAETVVGQPVLVRVAPADADGDAVTVMVASGPSHGVVEAIERDGLERLFAYTPSGGFEGTDAFTVGAADGHGGTATAMVTITVAGEPRIEPTPTAAPPFPTATPTPPLPPRISPDAACANGRLRLIDVFPQGARVRIRGVAPAAARGQTVAITFTATHKQVATAVVASDLSFATTARLPARKLRTSNRARYVATVAGERSSALKLARRLFLHAVTRTSDRLSVTGQVVKPLAKKPRDRRIAMRITTSCAASGGRKVRFKPTAGGKFHRSVVLTAAERSADALFVRAQTRVRRGVRSQRVIRTFSLTRAASLR